MSPEEQQLLNRAIELSEQNNKMLHAMRRNAAWAKAWGVVKLLIFVVPLIWAWLYLQPYIEKINALYQQTQKVQNLSEKDFQDWLRQFTGGSQIQAPTNQIKK